MHLEPLVEEITPCPDPWDVCRQLAHLPNLLFLDSALKRANVGCYSFITADPRVWITSRKKHVQYCFRRGETKTLVNRQANPFAEIQSCLHGRSLQTRKDLPPFQGGMAGLLGYELCHHIERIPRARLDEFEVPEMAYGMYDWVISFDHQQQKCWIISTGIPEKGQERLTQARKRLKQVTRWLDNNPEIIDRRGAEEIQPKICAQLEDFADVYSNFSKQQFLQAIQRGVDYVHAGDCFQVNLAQRLLTRSKRPPLELYGRLREMNPAPFAGYLDLGDFAIASASPERFLKVVGKQIETRPIKGTRPRGIGTEEDESEKKCLMESVKDRAENVMIVDLLRNDLGRVCEYGSIVVEQLCGVESYEYVHHLVSVVRGTLSKEKTPLDLLRAAFPGGSITGAPKVRAMEIINELEPTVRGPYCGSLGYIGFDGSMDTNLLIRTFTIGRGWIQFPVGGGIVADSTPEAEYVETLHKAEGMLRALK